MTANVNITIRRGSEKVRVPATRGETLRACLLAHAISPYRGRFRALNCKGMGICGSCTVIIMEADGPAQRRSCQIRCFHDMEIEIE